MMLFEPSATITWLPFRASPVGAIATSVAAWAARAPPATVSIWPGGTAGTAPAGWDADVTTTPTRRMQPTREMRSPRRRDWRFRLGIPLRPPAVVAVSPARSADAGRHGRRTNRH